MVSGRTVCGEGIQLKQEFGVELTNTQKKILKDIKNQKQDIEATREIMFEEQKQLAAIQSDEIEEAVEEAESDADMILFCRKMMKVPGH